MTDDPRARELDRRLRLPVRELGLSSRPAAYMRRNDIARIGDLVQRSETDMLQSRQFGERSLHEIRKKLAGMNLGLEMSIPGWSGTDGEAERVAALVRAGYVRPDPVPESGDGGDRAGDLFRLYSVRIRDLGLSTRSTNCLLYGKINFVGDLVQKTELQLGRLPRFGKISMEEIRRELATLGLALETDVGDWSPEWTETQPGRGAIGLGPELGADGAASFREELVSVIERILANRPVRFRTMLAYHQFDGGGPITLREIGMNGDAYGFGGAVTKARVDQILFAARAQVSGRRSNVRFAHWKPAVETARRSRVMSEAGFTALFGYADADPSFRQARGYRTLQFAAELFGLDFPFDSYAIAGRSVFVAGHGAPVRETHERLRGLVRGRAYLGTAEACRVLGAEPSLVESLVDLDPQMEFLDGMKEYFWNRPRLPLASYRKTGNPILTCLCKIFSVGERVSRDDIRHAMGKFKPLREEIPMAVLDGVVRRSGLFSSDGEFVTRKPGPDFGHVDAVDLAVLRVAAANGREIRSDVLYGALQDAGFSRNYSAVIVAYSPFLHNTTAGRGRRRGLHRLLFDPEDLDFPKLEAALARNRGRKRRPAAAPDLRRT